MSLLMLVFSVSPILAPLTGSLVIDAFGWRAVFWAVTGAAAIGARAARHRSPEKRGRASQRSDSGFAQRAGGLCGCCWATATSSA